MAEPTPQQLAYDQQINKALSDHPNDPLKAAQDIVKAAKDTYNNAQSGAGASALEDFRTEIANIQAATTNPTAALALIAARKVSKHYTGSGHDIDLGNVRDARNEYIRHENNESNPAHRYDQRDKGVKIDSIMESMHADRFSDNVRAEMRRNLEGIPDGQLSLIDHDLAPAKAIDLNRNMTTADIDPAATKLADIYQNAGFNISANVLDGSLSAAARDKFAAALVAVGKDAPNGGQIVNPNTDPQRSAAVKGALAGSSLGTTVTDVASQVHFDPHTTDISARPAPAAPVPAPQAQAAAPVPAPAPQAQAAAPPAAAPAAVDLNFGYAQGKSDTMTLQNGHLTAIPDATRNTLRDLDTVAAGDLDVSMKVGIDKTGTRVQNAGEFVDRMNAQLATLKGSRSGGLAGLKGAEVKFVAEGGRVVGDFDVTIGADGKEQFTRHGATAGTPDAKPMGADQLKVELAKGLKEGEFGQTGSGTQAARTGAIHIAKRSAAPGATV